MQAQKSFSWQSLIAILLVNVLLFVVLYTFVDDLALTSIRLITFVAIGLVATLLTWVIILYLANRMTDTIRVEQPTAKVHKPSAKPVAPTPTPSVDKRCLEKGAVQMLSILQRQGRLVDFLQEDLAQFEDAQIGAAVRSVHAGCKQALDEHVQLESIYDEPEGSQVTVEPGFDAYAVQLSGAVSGEPPFTGRLQHRGWRARDVDLPSRLDIAGDDAVIAAAEIEVS